MSHNKSKWGTTYWIYRFKDEEGVDYVFFQNTGRPLPVFDGCVIVASSFKEGVYNGSPQVKLTGVKILKDEEG